MRFLLAGGVPVHQICVCPVKALQALQFSFGRLGAEAFGIASCHPYPWRI
jgi:hypothetical protein